MALTIVTEGLRQAVGGVGAPPVEVVPGDTPENGMVGQDFFLSGEEVAPESFLNPSDYDPQYHTADGIMVSGDRAGGAEARYSPALAPAVVALLNQSHAFVMDFVLYDTPSAVPSHVGLTFDEAGGFLDVSGHYADHGDPGSCYLISTDGNDSTYNADLGVATVGAGRYRFAFTRDGTSLKTSVNGNPVVTKETYEITSIATIVLAVWEADLTEFTIYTDPVTVGADLQALSAL